MEKSAIRNPKSKILKALFAEAKKLGISQETLREDIAPGLIGKRLSNASSQEVARVLVYIHNRHGIPDADIVGTRSAVSPRYESSRRGLLQEVADLARQRFGDDFVRPLNALCERFKVEGYRSMRVTQAKAVKATLIRLQREDPRNVHRKDAEGAKEGVCRDTEHRVLIFHKGRKGFYNQLGEMDKL